MFVVRARGLGFLGAVLVPEGVHVLLLTAARV